MMSKTGKRSLGVGLAAVTAMSVTLMGAKIGELVSFHIPNETVPPGGVAQIKVLVTQPEPISGGRPWFDMDAAFSDIGGVSFYNRTGDVAGIASRTGSQVKLSYVTDSATLGNDYPIMTLALKVRPDAVVGQQALFSFDPSSFWTLFGQGATGFKPVAPALIAVGGSVSITGVVPGGGAQPAGTIVNVSGVGFQAGTRLKTTVPVTGIRVVSPTLMQFALAATTEMTGQRIQVVNPDGSKDLYYSYQRGVLGFESTKPLLQRSEPAFSARAYADGVLGRLALDTGGEYSGLAFQNPNNEPVDVDLRLFSPDGYRLGRSQVTLNVNGRLFAEVSELLGAAPQNGSWVSVRASSPIEMFSFTARENEGTTVPSLPLWAQ